MNDITLRAPGTDLDDLPLSQGRLAVGRAPEGGGLRAIADPAAARMCFCVDRRGTWLQVGEGVRGVHVNGRPVQRKAMLRAGDTVYVDGVEITLCGGKRADLPCGRGGSPDALVAASAAPTREEFGDPRIVLRGITGPHHGRSLTLDQPRSIGSEDAADIRIEGLAGRHAQLSMEGRQAVLRVLERDADVLVNGLRCREATLRPGDQVAFDAHHRFVLEAPTPVLGMEMAGEALDELPLPEAAPAPVPAPRRLRLPWLLLAALIIAAVLSALLFL